MLKFARNVAKLKLYLPKRTFQVSFHLKFPHYCLQNPNLKKYFGGPNAPLKRHLSSFKSDNVYLIDEEEDTSGASDNNVNKYTQRTHTCGDLRLENVGQHVVLCGWLEFQRMNKFAVLRDGYGATQILISDKDIETQKLLQRLPFETILQVKGTVLSRPDTMKNKKQATGDIEILVEDLTVLNKSKDNLPFNIREFQKAKESLRMQYRYLDLRFPLMQRNLRLRSQMLMKMREYLVNFCGFVDVETPTLFKATPGGAQEFIVPTRFPGQFYSLVQSPQQFKQMLMAGAIDRYFQIARCYRDEGARPDRQPEFTQLDIEMSFTNLEGILQLVEELLGFAWPKFLQPIPKKFPRMSYKDAMEFYGSDQPDIRFDFKLQNCSSIIEASCENFGAYCLAFPKELTINKAIKENIREFSKQFPLSKLIQVRVSHQDFIAKIGKALTEPVASKLFYSLKLQDESMLFLAYGDKKQTQTLLGKIRVEVVDSLEKLGLTIRKKGMHLLWIVDMPLFEAGDSPSDLKSAHHPFTAPQNPDIELLETNPLEVRSLSFDLVLNGNEIGGGSVRIHDPHLQEKIFDLLKIETTTMQHIIDMLSSGCPPHGGIALGIDRLLSKILNTSSIRDVIAFPKSFEGRDLMSGAPSPISESDQKLYHIKTID